MQLNIKKFFIKTIFILVIMTGGFSANAVSSGNSIQKLNLGAAKDYVVDLIKTADGYLQEGKEYIREYAQAHPDANINFRLSCNDGVGECIRVYRNAQVQMLQAQQIAIEHIKMNKGYDIRCSINYREESFDDYIKCTDYKGHFYEFQFDDIKESFDDTIQYSVADAMCRLYAGDSNIPICDIKKERAANFKKSLQKFGYDADCHQAYPQHPNKRCYVNYKSRQGNLRTVYGINTNKFKNLHVRSNADLLFLLERYANRMINEKGQKLNSFKCNNSFNTYYTDSFTNPKDDILTCYVNGKPVDFLFDDMNEAFEYESNSGTAGLTCIADAGGTFDGKNCQGLTKDQCIRLGRKVPGGVKWDNTLDTCLLKDAAKASAINEVISDVVSVGVAVGALVITIASGGSTLIVIASATATAGTAVGINNQYGKEEEIREIMSRIMRCNDVNCATTLFDEYINKQVQYIDDLDGTLLTATDEMIAHLLKLIAKDETNKKQLYEQLDQALADSQDITNIANWNTREIAGFTAKILQAVGSVISLGTAAWTSKGQNIMTLLEHEELPQTFNAFKEVASQASDAYDIYNHVDAAVTALGAS